MNKYEILGVSPNSSITEVKAAYRAYMLILHPDKKGKLKMSDKDRDDLYYNVRKAYEEILSEKKEYINFPDYKIDYNIDSNVTIRKEQDLFSSDGKINLDKFNRHFEQEKTQIEKDGMANPFERGYNDIFNASTEEKKRDMDMLKTGTRVNIEVTKNPELKQVTQLVKHNPAAGNKSTNLGYTELGLATVDDFSFKSSCKGGICGSDISVVYGSNNEYWEHTAMRNKDIHDKYTDTTEISKKMSSVQGEREVFDPKQKDPEIERQIAVENERLRKLEELRRLNFQNSLAYHSNRNLMDRR